MGKDLLAYYDPALVPIRDLPHLEELKERYSELYIVSAFEGFVGDNRWGVNDLLVAQIKREGRMLKLLPGTHPVRIYILRR